MARTFIFILNSIGIGLLFSIPGIIIGFWLEKNKCAPNRYRLSILFCIVIVGIQRLQFPSLPFHWLALILLIGSTIGVYRRDIFWAMNK